MAKSGFQSAIESENMVAKGSVFHLIIVTGLFQLNV